MGARKTMSLLLAGVAAGAVIREGLRRSRSLDLHGKVVLSPARLAGSDLQWLKSSPGKARGW
jgi:hypothetical protein